MANLIETIDLQRAVRSAAFKKAAQLYNSRNIARWNLTKPTTNQIRGVFRIGYGLLKKDHEQIKWLQDLSGVSRKIKNQHGIKISKLDLIAAGGGKPLMQELYDKIINIGGIPIEMAPPTRFTRSYGPMSPEPPEYV